MAKVRPSKDFLRPLEQNVMMHYHSYGHHFVRKAPRSGLFLDKNLKNKSKNFFAAPTTLFL